MYRRKAGSGTPSMSRGRISGGYFADAGERIERVRRSSEGMDGAVKLENDFAAVRRARSEAVRLDLKVNFEGFGLGLGKDDRCGLKDSGSTGEVGRRGWSSRLISSFGGEETVFSFRSRGDFRGVDVDGSL